MWMVLLTLGCLQTTEEQQPISTTSPPVLDEAGKETISTPPLSVPSATALIRTSSSYTEEACALAGGLYQYSFYSGTGYCVFKTTDDGMDCDDNSQCQGLCEPHSVNQTTGSKGGVCSQYEDRSGCGLQKGRDGMIRTRCI